MQHTPPNYSQTCQNEALKLDFYRLCALQSTKFWNCGISLFLVGAAAHLTMGDWITRLLLLLGFLTFQWILYNRYLGELLCCGS